MRTTSKKMTPQQKAQRTRRRNKRSRDAKRSETAAGRLVMAGAHEPAQLRKRLLWFAIENGIPAAKLPKVGTTVTAALVNFAKRYDLNLNWFITGALADLRTMVRARCVSECQRKLHGIALMAAVDERLHEQRDER